MKVYPGKSVSGEMLTDDTESSAFAGWPARKIAGLMPNVMRPVCAAAGVANGKTKSNEKPNKIARLEHIRRMVFSLSAGIKTASIAVNERLGPIPT